MRADVEPPTDPAAYPFRHAVRARFAETDAMGVVHHAAYLPYLEEARVALLRARGRPYVAIRDEGLDVSVVEARLAYRRAVRFDDVVVVHVRLHERRGATFTLAYLLTVQDVVAATAVTVHAFLDGSGRPARVPGWVGSLGADDTGEPRVEPGR